MPDDQARLAPLIAVIGCDGSGKSTVSEAILNWVQSFAPAQTAHLGKQSGNIGRSIAGLPLIGGMLDKIIARKTDNTRAQRNEKTPGILVSLIIYAFSLRRLRRFKRMMAMRRRGMIIITDRYPQLDVPGAYDGTGLSTNAPGNSFVQWLARRERKLYEWMTSYQPDLVIRLNVDLDTACSRKPDHRRSLLRDKVAATPLLRFNGAPIVEIDASLPLSVVNEAAKAAVTQTLTKLGYSVTPT